MTTGVYRAMCAVLDLRVRHSYAVEPGLLGEQCSLDTIRAAELRSYKPMCTYGLIRAAERRSYTRGRTFQGRGMTRL